MGVRGNSAQGKMSRRKGCTFERDVANAFKAWLGFDVRRTPMSGAYDPKWDLGGDLMFEEPFPFYVEIRNRESWRLEQFFQEEPTGPVWQWMKETEGAATASGRLPMLIVKRNHVPALVCLRASEVMPLKFRDARKVVRIMCWGWIVFRLDVLLASDPQAIHNIKLTREAKAGTVVPVDFR